MKWEPRKGWDGVCEWQVYELGDLGTFTVEEYEGKWMAAWEPSDRQWIVENIDTESAAKATVAERMRLAITQLGNALAAGERRVFEDDGA